ncbi:hypothetical protein [Microbacterium sp. CJ88]|uniref:hypothetical protein n=1 Tax=Microbacterium sp. CJ88 TaxID=3445672 RepID=UPI003F656AA0
MTVRGVLAAIGRRWYVFVVVLVAFGALTFAFYRDGGSYFTHTTVTFSLPERPTLLPDSGNTDTSIIAFAGAVAVAINEGKPILTYSEADAPYYGAGVREGVIVSLRNGGNQWVSNFPSGTIDIQIVGRSKEWVAERQSDLLAKVAAVAQGQQTDATTPSADQITTSIAPLSTEISQITAGRSSQVMAAAAMTAAGLIVATTAAVGVDRIIRRRRRAQAPSSARYARDYALTGRTT